MKVNQKHLIKVHSLFSCNMVINVVFHKKNLNLRNGVTIVNLTVYCILSIITCSKSVLQYKYNAFKNKTYQIVKFFYLII